MDIGRDLIDHRIVDLDGHDVGRVDDLWVYVSGGRATVGPIVSGAAALFQQFGALGRRLQRIAPRVGYRHATRWREYGWDDVDALQRPQVVLTPRLSDLATRPEGHLPRPGTEMLYTRLIHLPVCDPAGQTIGVVDVRTTLANPEPEILGFLVAAHPLRYTMGMKRFDTTSERFAGTHHNTRYLAWNDIATIDQAAIQSRIALADLPLLSDIPASPPPPMPDHADTP